MIKASNCLLKNPNKRCWFTETSERWPWMPESAKKCVSTHLSNGLALNMDGDEAGSWHQAAQMRFIALDELEVVAFL